MFIVHMQNSAQVKSEKSMENQWLSQNDVFFSCTQVFIWIKSCNKNLLKRKVYKYQNLYEEES